MQAEGFWPGLGGHLAAARPPGRQAALAEAFPEALGGQRGLRCSCSGGALRVGKDLLQRGLGPMRYFGKESSVVQHQMYTQKGFEVNLKAV